jgi:hypothetical protein
MNKHLLHQPVEKVLLFWVGAFGQDLLEVVHDGCEHFPEVVPEREDDQDDVPRIRQTAIRISDIDLYPNPAERITLIGTTFIDTNLSGRARQERRTLPWRKRSSGCPM